LNILFVHEVDYLGKPVYEIHEFPELLALRGHKVIFIQFAEGYKFWRAKHAPQNILIHGKVHNKAKLLLLTPFQLGVPGLDRILAIFTFVPLLKRVLGNQSIDVIVNYAVPTFGLQTTAIAKRCKIPVVFRALDVSHKIRNTIFSPLIKESEKIVYRNSTLISANNVGLANYCKALGGPAVKAVTNFPPLDLGHFKDAGKTKGLARSLGIKQGDRVIVYMGNFFYFSGLAQVIQAFAQIRPENIKLLLIGGGEQDQELRHLVEKLGLGKDVLFTGFIDYRKLPEYFSIVQVAINPMEPSLVSNSALPQKVLQYIASGLPVVSTKLTGLRATFPDSAGITWVESPAEVLATAVDLCRDPRRISAAVRKQLSFCERNFGLENTVYDFENTLKLSIGLAS
jgi:glycosyltransferase involved in cell wall biosynthesis